MRNTKEQGQYTLLVYRQAPNYSIGVCLEFDLIQEGKTLQEALENIKRVSFLYLKTVIKKNWPDDLLNQPAPTEYWKKYNNCLRKMAEQIKKKVEELKKEFEEKKKLAYWQTVLQQMPYTKQNLEKEKAYA